MNYDYIGISFSENNESVSLDKIKHAFELSKENDVLLVKETYNKDLKSIDLYISVSQLTIPTENNKHFDSLSTFPGSDKSSYLIHDFLNNDRFQFFTTDYMDINDVYMHGNYSLYYRDDIALENFINSLESLLGVPREDFIIRYWGQLEENTILFQTFIIISFIFFFIFYFLLIVFQLYRDSRKIGCYSLLGFRPIDITKELCGKQFKKLMILSIVQVVLCIFMLPNPSLEFIKALIFTAMTILISTLCLSHIALLSILHYSSVANLIKKKSFILRITKVYLIMKCILILGILVFLTSFFPFLLKSGSVIQELSNNRLLMNYAVFARISVENHEANDYDKFLNFYRALKRENIDTIYVSFGDYVENDENTIQYFEEVEKDGKSFRLASVDENYLNLYNIEYYDINNNLSQIDFNQIEIYLLPFSKIHYTDPLLEIIEARNLRYEIKEDIKIYYYKDQEFDTFDSSNGRKKVMSPILRVVNSNYPYTYFEKPYGIDIAGTLMKTGLKFRLSTNNFFIDKIQPLLIETGLQNVLVEENFISYLDFYNDEKSLLLKGISIVSLGTLCTFSLYFILLVQIMILYIEANSNEITVKSLLGYANNDTILPCIKITLSVTCISIFGYLTYLLLSSSFNPIVVIILSTIILSIDWLLILCSLKLIKINSICENLKRNHL